MDSRNVHPKVSKQDVIVHTVTVHTFYSGQIYTFHIQLVAEFGADTVCSL